MNQFSHELFVLVMLWHMSFCVSNQFHMVVVSAGYHSTWFVHAICGHGIVVPLGSLLLGTPSSVLTVTCWEHCLWGNWESQYHMFLIFIYSYIHIILYVVLVYKLLCCLDWLTLYWYSSLSVEIILSAQVNTVGILKPTLHYFVGVSQWYLQSMHELNCYGVHGRALEIIPAFWWLVAC